MFGKKKKKEVPTAPEPEEETGVIETREVNGKQKEVKVEEPKLTQEEMEDIQHYQAKYQHTYPADVSISEVCNLLFGILSETRKLRDDIRKLNEDINKIAAEESSI